jgi:hypothetical protein
MNRINRLAVISLSMMAVIVIVVILLSHDHEVKYQRRPVSDWVSELNSRQAPTRERAETAIVELGTNALPFLLLSLSHEESGFSRGLSWLRSRLLRRAPEISEYDRGQVAALKAFALLGTRAEPAIPALTSLLSNERSSHNAGRALAHIGEPSLPVLIAGLTNKNAMVRLVAARELGWVRDGASSIVPALSGRVHDIDVDVRRAAVGSLGALAALPDDSIPPLLIATHDPDTDVRRAAAHALGRFGDSANHAVSRLIELTGDSHPFVRGQAALSSIKIDARLSCELLIGRLSSDDFQIRLGAAESLGLFTHHADDILPSLANTLKCETEAPIREALKSSIEKLERGISK